MLAIHTVPLSSKFYAYSITLQQQTKKKGSMADQLAEEQDNKFAENKMVKYKQLKQQQ